MMTLASAGGAAVSTVTRPRRSASGVAILDLSEKREGGGAGDRYVGRKAFLLFTRGFARSKIGQISQQRRQLYLPRTTTTETL
jgi:hypothetical protein